MYINVKRLKGIAFFVCVAVLVVIIIESKIFAIELEFTNPATIPLTMLITTIIFTILISMLGAWWFLRSSGKISFIKGGLYFGLTLSAMGFVGDVVAFVPHEGGLDVFVSYFSYCGSSWHLF
ncbi:MAG: hypothetical protein Q8P90_02660 [bacterium]|nr:hypothetical protein [bacterium]